MKKFNIMGGLLVLLCSLVVSYSHSIQLFQLGGFSGVMAHIAVIAAEVTFIMGALAIIVARTKGERPPLPAIMGGILGVTLVGWSNVAAGWSYGITGILLGLATPASLITAEAILSRAIINTKKQPAQPDQSDKEQPTAQETTQPATENPPTIPPATDQPNPPKTPKRKSKKAPTRKTAQPATDITKWAMEFYRQQNKLPSRRKVAEKAGVTEWQARKILESLEKQIS